VTGGVLLGRRASLAPVVGAALACSPQVQRPETVQLPPLAQAPVPSPAPSAPPAPLEPVDAGALVPPAADAEVVCSGRATPAMLQLALKRAGAVRSCYVRSLRLNGSLGGKLHLRLRIDPEGNVVDYAILEDTLVADPAFYPCAKGMFTGPFPAPEGGCLNMKIPLSFVPREADAGADARP
jgi:hypothetical protein